MAVTSSNMSSAAKAVISKAKEKQTNASAIKPAVMPNSSVTPKSNPNTSIQTSAGSGTIKPAVLPNSSSGLSKTTPLSSALETANKMKAAAASSSGNGKSKTIPLSSVLNTAKDMKVAVTSTKNNVITKTNPDGTKTFYQVDGPSDGGPSSDAESRIKSQVQDELDTQIKAINDALARGLQANELAVQQNKAFLDEQIKKYQDQKLLNDEQAKMFQNRRGGFYSGGLDYQLGQNTSSTLSAQDAITREVNARNADIYNRNALMAEQAANQISLLQSQAPNVIRQRIAEELDKQWQKELQETQIFGVDKNGRQTLQAQGQFFDQKAVEAGITGKWGGQDTLQKTEADRQFTLQEGVTRGQYATEKEKALFNEYISLKRAAENPTTTAEQRAANSKRAREIEAELALGGLNVNQYLGKNMTSQQVIGNANKLFATQPEKERISNNTLQWAEIDLARAEFNLAEADQAFQQKVAAAGLIGIFEGQPTLAALEFELSKQVQLGQLSLTEAAQLLEEAKFQWQQKTDTRELDQSQEQINQRWAEINWQKHYQGQQIAQGWEGLSQDEARIAADSLGTTPQDMETVMPFYNSYSKKFITTDKVTGEIVVNEKGLEDAINNNSGLTIPQKELLHNLFGLNFKEM